MTTAAFPYGQDGPLRARGAIAYQAVTGTGERGGTTARAPRHDPHLPTDPAPDPRLARPRARAPTPAPPLLAHVLVRALPPPPPLPPPAVGGGVPPAAPHQPLPTVAAATATHDNQNPSAPISDRPSNCAAMKKPSRRSASPPTAGGSPRPRPTAPP